MAAPASSVIADEAILLGWNRKPLSTSEFRRRRYIARWTRNNSGKGVKIRSVVKRSFLKLMAEAVVAMGIAVMVIGGYITYRYAYSRPTVMQEQVGRVYPMNVHGSVVYLTKGEHISLIAFDGAGLACFVAAAAIAFAMRRRTVAR